MHGRVGGEVVRRARGAAKGRFKRDGKQKELSCECNLHSLFHGASGMSLIQPRSVSLDFPSCFHFFITLVAISHPLWSAAPFYCYLVY